jgi:hypothetical protein
MKSSDIQIPIVLVFLFLVVCSPNSLHFQPTPYLSALNSSQSDYQQGLAIIIAQLQLIGQSLGQDPNSLNVTAVLPEVLDMSAGLENRLVWPVGVMRTNCLNLTQAQNNTISANVAAIQ